MPRSYTGSESALLGTFGVLDHTANIVDIPDAAVSDTERETLIAGLMCNSPIEMKNDQKERNGYSTVAAILMMWIQVPSSGEIKEQQRIVITENSSEYLIRKVKKWPHVDPIFIELHVEDET